VPTGLFGAFPDAFVLNVTDRQAHRFHHRLVVREMAMVLMIFRS
jgi:hypothetical protein